MPRALLKRLASRIARGFVALAAALLVAGPPRAASAQSAQVSIDVPPGKVKTVRLRHLPLGTAVAVVVVASGKLRTALISASEIKSARPRALFSGAFERKLSFRVVIPETADYYLLLDNRRGTEPVSATAEIRAQRGAAKPRPDDTPKAEGDKRARSSRAEAYAAGLPSFLPSRSQPMRSYPPAEAAFASVPSWCVANEEKLGEALLFGLSLA